MESELLDPQITKTTVTVLLEHSYNERELVSQLTQGDQAAFEKIYVLYRGRLYGKLLRLLKSEPQAKEILQDIFLKVWDNRTHIDPSKSFRSYLFQISINTAYDCMRKTFRGKHLQSEMFKDAREAYSDIEEKLINKEHHEILTQAINLLPPKRRNIFTLCKIDGKSYDEVSRQLGISSSTISDHIVKANTFLRQYLVRVID